MKITRRQLRKLITESVTISPDFWQQPESREKVLEAYTTGENRAAFINDGGVLKRKVFKKGTDSAIVESYYDMYILPQVEQIVNETMVYDQSRSDIDVTHYNPNTDKIVRAGNDMIALNKAVLEKAPRGLKWPKIIFTKGFFKRLVNRFKEWLEADLWGTRSPTDVREDWKKYTFLHELFHAIDDQVHLLAGIENEKSELLGEIRKYESGDAENPFASGDFGVFLPHITDWADANTETRVFDRFMSKPSRLRSNFESLEEIQYDDLLKTFPDLKPGGQGEDHSERAAEIYDEILRLRAQQNRPFTEKDIQKIKTSTSYGAEGWSSDIRDALKRNQGEKTDKEVADELNRISKVDKAEVSPGSVVAETHIRLLARKILRQKYLREEEERGADLDPRFDITDRVPLMPLEDKYSWAQYEEVPASPRLKVQGKKLLHIPAENIPDDFVLPTMGSTAAVYQSGLYGQVQRPYGAKGKIYEPKTKIATAVKQLRNISAWMYGTQFNPIPDHPDEKINGKMMPPAYSVYLEFLKNRVRILKKKIDSGEREPEEVAKREGFKNADDFYNQISKFNL